MSEFHVTTYTASVNWNREWEEWIVEFYCGRTRMPDSSYHTDCENDAHATAWMQCYMYNHIASADHVLRLF